MYLNNSSLEKIRILTNFVSTEKNDRVTLAAAAALNHDKFQYVPYITYNLIQFNK